MKNIQSTTTSVGTEKPQEYIVGLIYATWCGYCNQMKPAWDKFAENIKNDDGFKNLGGIVKEIESAELDVENNTILKDIHIDLKRETYPCIFKVNKGKLSYYKGDRTEEAFKKWALDSSTTSSNTDGDASKVGVGGGARGGNGYYIRFRDTRRSSNKRKSAYRKKTRRNRSANKNSKSRKYRKN